MRHESISPELFIENRRRLCAMLPPNALAVVNTNDILPTNADGTQTIVANSDLFHLTGVEQEQTILVLYPGADDERNREILFLREPTEEARIWEGCKFSKEEAQKQTGIANIQWLHGFPRLFHRLMCACDAVFLNSNEHARAVIEVESRESRFVAETMRKYPLHDYRRLAPLMHRLRAVKSETEVKLIRRACEITGQAFERVLRFMRPGVAEYEVEAEFAHEFITHRSRFAYPPIIGSGANACCLHYTANESICRDGELVLLDVAASYANYNADMTRTIPVSGRFTRRQKQVYNSVLRVLRQCIAALIPGIAHKTWQKQAEQMIERELLELGLLKMSDIKRQKPDAPALRKYFMHGVGHPLGLDVHDVAVLSEPMQAGWVMTVEPAIYIPEEGFAVRLENDVLLTDKGPVDLMAHIPIEVDEIEEIMSVASAGRRGDAARKAPAGSPGKRR